MWGIAFRFSGNRVEPSVPGWLMNAAATYEAIGFVEQVVAELARTPELYGYDPHNEHHLFFQTWDKAISGVQSVAFGRNVVGHSAVHLVPDFYYLHSQGFRGLREAALAGPRWERRSPTLVWRGSVTGNGAFTAPIDIPRVRLARIARDLPDADIGLTGVHSTMESVFSPSAIEAYIAETGIAGDFWPMAKFGHYKYALDIDGHANAWGFLEKLIVGCCVLKVATPFEQWFYPRLRPWIHYVPVDADLSNLAERLAWCRDNDDRCGWIARNGAILAASLSMEAQLPQSCAAVLAASQVESLPANKIPPDTAGSAQLPEAEAMEEARRCESLDRPEQAIAIYQRLADAGLGGPEALNRLSLLHRKQGDLPAALVALERAAARSPQAPDARLRLAQTLSALGRESEAVAQLRQAIEAVPWGEELRINLAGLCYRLGWLDMAFRAVRELPEKLPDWWGDMRATVLTQFRERRDEATALLRARRRGQPLDHGTCWDLAVRLALLGRLTMAQRLCEHVATNTPEVFPPRDLISRIVARRDGAEAALAYLRGLPAGMHEENDYVVRAGRFLLDLGRYEEVLRELGDRPAIADSFDVKQMTEIAAASLGRATSSGAGSQQA